MCETHEHKSIEQCPATYDGEAEFKKEFDKKYNDLMVKGLIPAEHYFKSQHLYCLYYLGVFQTKEGSLESSYL